MDINYPCPEGRGIPLSYQPDCDLRRLRFSDHRKWSLCTCVLLQSITTIIPPP
jgi:hypothetical protein